VGTHHHPSVRMGTQQHMAARNKTLSSVTEPIQASFFIIIIYITLECHPSPRTSQTAKAPYYSTNLKLQNGKQLYIWELLWVMVPKLWFANPENFRALCGYKFLMRLFVCTMLHKGQFTIWGNVGEAVTFL
jgi:hypothetical protein